MQIDASDVSKLAENIIRWRVSPASFVREAIGATPTPQQAVVLAAFSQPSARVAVKSGHGVGKSALSSWLILWSLLCWSGSTVGCTAPTAHQLKDILWRELDLWRGKLLGPMRELVRVVDAHASVDYGNGRLSEAFARTSRADKPDALQGLHGQPMIYVIDEASGVDEAVFETAFGTLTTAGARVIMLGNPVRTTGYFHRAFHAARDQWTGLTLSCVDSPMVDPKYCKDMADEYGESSDIYRVRVLGDFPSSSDMQFIPSDLVERARRKIIASEKEFNYAPVILGVDVAAHGQDEAVIMMRQGIYSKRIWSKRGVDLVTLSGTVAMFEDKHNAAAVCVDACGMGVGVVDQLRAMGRNPFAVDSGGKSVRKDCFNKRAEMWAAMRDWLGVGKIDDDDTLRDDLCGPEYQYDIHGRYQLERKQDMRRRGIASPDRADALAFTFAVPVLPDNREVHKYAKDYAQDVADYSPFEYNGGGRM